MSTCKKEASINEYNKHLLLIEVSLVTIIHVTNCIWHNCATCTAYVSTKIISLSKKYFTLNENKN